jgi:hypothetical protein
MPPERIILAYFGFVGLILGMAYATSDVPIYEAAFELLALLLVCLARPLLNDIVD